MKKRHKIVLSVYLILKTSDGILLGKRQNTGFEDGNWALPAGHVEDNESAKIALCREIKEEIGITLSPENLTLAHVSHRRSAERDNIDLFMTCDQWEGTVKNCEPHKCSELRFFSLEALPENTVGYIREVVEAAFKQELYSEKGWERVEKWSL